MYLNREPCISNKTRNNSLEHLFDVKQKDMFTANISLNWNKFCFFFTNVQQKLEVKPHFSKKVQPYFLCICLNIYLYITLTILDLLLINFLCYSTFQ